MNPVQVDQVIEMAYKLQAKTPENFRPKLDSFQPLLKVHYPIFNKYPENIVNYQKKLREKIHKEEKEYKAKRQLAQEIAIGLEQKRKEEQERMRDDYERKRRDQIWQEKIKLEQKAHEDFKETATLENLSARINQLRELQKDPEPPVSKYNQDLETKLQELEEYEKTRMAERQQARRELERHEDELIQSKIRSDFKMDDWEDDFRIRRIKEEEQERGLLHNK